jgi:hypothetical protein
VRERLPLLRQSLLFSHETVNSYVGVLRAHTASFECEWKIMQVDVRPCVPFSCLMVMRVMEVTPVSDVSAHWNWVLGVAASSHSPLAHLSTSSPARREFWAASSFAKTSMSMSCAPTSLCRP